MMTFVFSLLPANPCSRLFSATILVLFTTSTRATNSYIMNIYNIYLIIDISAFREQCAINIFNIYSIYFIINIYILCTNCGHCPHSFTNFIYLLFVNK